MSYKEFRTLDKQIDRLYADGNFNKAIEKLNGAFQDFPEHYFEMYFYKLICHRSLGNFDICLDMIKQGNKEGYFFDINWNSWDPMRSLEAYEKVNKDNQSLLDNAQEDARMVYKVHLPEGYSEKKTYPLFIVLHGDGNCCNINYFENQWKPNVMLKRDMIVVYIQSSVVSCSGGFGWTKDYPKSREEILTCYMEVTRDYSVDTNQVICGGFSGGSMTSINIMMNRTIPLKGIVALCPGETDNTTPENIRKAAELGIKAVILEGEESEPDLWQTSFMNMLKENEISFNFIENKNIGHEVPEDLDQALVKAMDFILN